MQSVLHCSTALPQGLLSYRVEAKAHKLDQYRKEAHEVRQLEQDLSLDYPHGLPVSLLLPFALLLHANVTIFRSNLGWCVTFSVSSSAGDADAACLQLCITAFWLQPYGVLFEQIVLSEHTCT